MTKRYGYVYKCTYLKNNKIYIGQKTGNKIQENYYGSGSLWVSEVINKCDIEKDIKREILEWCYSNKQLNEREKYWINFYDSTNPSIGYNIMLGGGPFNEEYRENMSKTISNIMETTDARNKISQSLKEYRKNNDFTETHRKRLSNAMKGNHNFGNSIPVYCILDTGESHTFSSIKEAGKWWHEELNPFKHYSVSVYRRKILKAINENIIFYYNRRNGKKEYITNIKWFLGKTEKGGDANDSQD